MTIHLSIKFPRGAEAAGPRARLRATADDLPRNRPTLTMGGATWETLNITIPGAHHTR